MKCYRPGGCGPYEQTPCNECPYSKPQGSLRIIKESNGSFDFDINNATENIKTKENAQMLCRFCGTPMKHFLRFLPGKAYEMYRCPKCWAEGGKIPYKLGDEKKREVVKPVANRAKSANTKNHRKQMKANKQKKGVKA